LLWWRLDNNEELGATDIDFIMLYLIAGANEPGLVVNAIHRGVRPWCVAICG